MSKRFTLKTLAALGAVAIGSMLISTGAQAQQKLKWAHAYETSEPYHIDSVWAAEEIKKRSNGKFDIQVFPASTLGKETDINQGLTLGTVDIIYTGQLFAARTHPPLAIGGAPFMFRDFNHWKAYVASPVYADLAELAAAHRETKARAEAQRREEQARESRKPDILIDLLGHLRAEAGLSEAEAAAAVRNAVWAFQPDQAPVEHKLQLLELRQQRAQAQAEQRQAQEQLAVYNRQLTIAAKSAQEQDFPASVDFYDGDHDRYVRALHRVASDMATKAQAEGIYADLTPRAVQQHLEAQLEAKLTKVQQKRTARATPKADDKVASEPGATSPQPNPETPRVTEGRPLTKAEADAKLRLLGW